MPSVIVFAFAICVSLRRYSVGVCLGVLACVTTDLHAGIHIAGEKLQPVAELSEFYKQQLPFLRGYGPPDVTMGGKPTPQREDFLKKVETLRSKKQLSADEQANLGGYLLYLKQTAPRQPAFEEAVTVLEAGYRANPRHFALAANLGTAYQLTGRLDAAERCMQNAVDLSPEPLRAMEQLHLRLVQLRLRENLARGTQPDLDLLFGRAAAPFRFVDGSGKWNYGNLAPAEVAKLPHQSTAEASRQVEQLLVWLPDDGRLHWQLAEWALVSNQLTIALDLYRDSVNTFRLSNPNLKQRRALVQEAFNWRSLLERLAARQEPATWLAESLGQSIASASSPSALGQQMLQVGLMLPVKKKKGDLFSDKGGVVADNDPLLAAKPFEIQPWHWGLIGIGVVAMIFMLYWQLREWYRRLARHSGGK